MKCDTCTDRAMRTLAYIRKLHREIAAYEKFADRVRDTSTSEQLRTHADILLSKKSVINKPLELV